MRQRWTTTAVTVACIAFALIDDVVLFHRHDVHSELHSFAAVSGCLLRARAAGLSVRIADAGVDGRVVIVGGRDRLPNGTPYTTYFIWRPSVEQTRRSYDEMEPFIGPAFWTRLADNWIVAGTRTNSDAARRSITQLCV